MDLKGLFIKIDIKNILEVSEYFDAICSVSNKNFTGVSMLSCVQRNHFPYLGTFDGKIQSFTTKVDETRGEQVITLEQLKKINYEVYLFNKA